ncbi:amino acid kinase family protein [Methylobacterium sp. A54F]
MSGLSVVKVGGSLLADRAALADVLRGLVEGREGPCLVVPGGGPFADAVRTAQAALGLSDALAHRLALDAMGRTAEVLRAVEPRLTICDAPEALTAFAPVPVWDPLLLKVGHPEIPETWDVTSDSLALWLAARLKAARCLILKSAAVPVGADLAALARLGLVDAAAPAFAARFPGAIEIRGPAARAAA